MQDVLASGDADGDGGLDYAELTAINPVLYETLGLKDATALLKKFDYNNDGRAALHWSPSTFQSAIQARLS